MSQEQLTPKEKVAKSDSGALVIVAFFLFFVGVFAVALFFGVLRLLTLGEPSSGEDLWGVFALVILTLSIFWLCVEFVAIGTSVISIILALCARKYHKAARIVVIVLDVLLIVGTILAQHALF